MRTGGGRSPAVIGGSRGSRLRTLAIAALCVAAVSGVAASQSQAKKIYWGAWIGSQLTGTEAPYDMGAVHRFERNARKRVSLVEWSLPFADCTGPSCFFFHFPETEMRKVRGHGAIPVLSWGSSAIGSDSTPNIQPAFQLSDIIAGRYDGYIRSFARGAKRWGHPFFLRFNWEPNGDWFPWGIHTNGNRPRQFVPAWRHVHRIFRRVGARNATWVWCPYVDTRHRDNFRRLYPGGRFVDWTCLDGYNWGPGSPANPKPWRSFNELFHSSYRRVVRRVAPKKPMILAEVASSDYGGNKARWIRKMLSQVPRRYRKVRGLVYFDVNDRVTHWPLETSRRVIRAFRRGINRSSYVPNRFGRIKARPIRPPRPRR